MTTRSTKAKWYAQSKLKSDEGTATRLAIGAGVRARDLPSVVTAQIVQALRDARREAYEAGAGAEAEDNVK